MSTKKPQIDLSECNIGRSVRLRNGDIVQLEQYKRSLAWPVKTSTGFVYRKDGRWDAEKKTGYDIVAISPPEKPKKAGKPPKKNTLDRLTSAFAKIAFKGDNDLIRKAADALEGLLNP